MSKKKRGGKCNRIGLHCLSDYDEHGNICLSMSYPVNGQPHYLCDFQIQFEEECICVYKVCKNFFDEIHQARWKKALASTSFDEFTINICLERESLKAEQKRLEEERKRQEIKEAFRLKKQERIRKHRLQLRDTLAMLKYCSEILDVFFAGKPRTDNITNFTLKERLLNDIIIPIPSLHYPVKFIESKHSYNKDGLFMVDVLCYFFGKKEYGYFGSMLVDEANRTITIVEKCQCLDNKRVDYINQTLKLLGLGNFKILYSKKYSKRFKQEIGEVQ